MSEESGVLLTHQERKEYNEAFKEFAFALQAHGKAAMELADALSATQELSKLRGERHKKIRKIIGRIAKARDIDPDSIVDVDRERGVLVLK